MALSYLLTGGNIGDRLNYIYEAKENIKKSVGKIIKESKIYETEPWGFSDESYFLNQVLLIETDFNPHELLKAVNLIEKNMGRERTKAQYSSRIIDIDILFYDNLIINNTNLIIPHPQIQNRRFTLIPLNEINSDFIHPFFNKSISTLLEECIDKSKVKTI